jgi:proline iminopeptidase
VRRTLLVATGLLGTWAALRPRLMNLGATRPERARPLPGDDLVPGPRSTMATTLPAPPGRVWPWLVQMGAMVDPPAGCRPGAGWYSVDRLDNGGRPSATAVLPEHQHLAPGDRVASSARTWFTAAVVDPPRALVYRFRGTMTGRMADLDGPLPLWAVDSIWGFALIDRGDGTTRLLVRSRGSGRPEWFHRLAALLVWDPGHLLMQQVQFRGLRRRVARAGPP